MQSIARYVKKHKINSGALLFLVIILTTTRPTALPAAMIVAVFLAIILLLFNAVRWIASRLAHDPFKIIFVSIASTFVAGLLLVLQATGQLTIRDFVTVLALFAVGWVYVSRFSISRSP